MESAFDVSTQCVNFHWTPASRWTLAALALLWAAFHALFAYRRSWQSHGFLEGHERVCVGLRLLSNLLWYALLVENMAKLHTRQDTADSQQPPAAAAAADAAYTPSLALSGLGHVLRFQATVGLLLALVSHGGASGGGGLMGQRRCSADVLDEGLRPCGLSRICRHPQLFGVFVYSLSFGLTPAPLLPGNVQAVPVEWCDVMFWGVHGIASLVGMLLEDRRMRKDSLGRYDRYLAESPLFPRLDRIFSMTVMEMRALVIRMMWSVMCVTTLYAFPGIRGYFQSACGGWILNVYALVHYTRDLLLKQASMDGLIPAPFA
eukprot:TRINITY_DN19011_c0_g1_i3.p1 TRINITY_DN19011_c0_g1~~TRINITY_DN19011_c0_g1_i3.p1  ORF type:complete len:318 (+),score=41.78 TRINITY_DN19011_c0_g1_i3:70-1023(+)